MDLLLYVMQQLGVMFAVGAQTIILLAYLLSVRDGVVDSQEERFAHAIKKVLFLGIILILISGTAITALELFAGNHTTVFAPAYVFKASLIGLVVFLSLAIRGDSLPEGLLEGLAGGTWYALFIVHILAPVAQWNHLVLLYVLWIIGFMACWSALVFMMRGRVAAYADVPKKDAPRPAPRATLPPRYQAPPTTPVRKPTPTITAAVQSQKSPPQQAVYTPPAPQKNFAPAPQAPTPLPHQKTDLPLPGIRVMPKSPEDIGRQGRSGMVELSAHPL